MIDQPIATILAALIGATATITGAIIAARAKTSAGAAAVQAGSAQTTVQSEQRPALEPKSKLYSALLLTMVILLVAVSVFFLILEIIAATGMSSRIQGETGAALLFAILFAIAAQSLNVRRKKIFWSTMHQPTSPGTTSRE